MKLFLVEGVVYAHQYMGETTSCGVQRIVWAESCVEAEEKFNKFYADQSQEYSTTYSTYGVAEEAIQ